MTTAALAGGEPEGMHGLLNACNIVSAMRYEGAETAGRLVVAKRGHPGVEVTLALASPVPLREYRAVRKLLEISSSDIGLLTDSTTIYGSVIPPIPTICSMRHFQRPVYQPRHLGIAACRAPADARRLRAASPTARTARREQIPVVAARRLPRHRAQAYARALRACLRSRAPETWHAASYFCRREGRVRTAGQAMYLRRAGAACARTDPASHSDRRRAAD